MEPFRVYRHFLKTKSRFMIHVISLIPVWIGMRWWIPMHQPGDQLDIWRNLGHRLLRTLPLCTVGIQWGQSLMFFRQPPQAQPFNRRLLSAKYFSKVMLIIISVFCLFAFLWIIAGCEESTKVKFVSLSLILWLLW